jgi:hypothetical protein
MYITAKDTSSKLRIFMTYVLYYERFTLAREVGFGNINKVLFKIYVNNGPQLISSK